MTRQAEIFQDLSWLRHQVAMLSVVLEDILWNLIFNCANEVSVRVIGSVASDSVVSDITHHPLKNAFPLVCCISWLSGFYITCPALKETLFNGSYGTIALVKPIPGNLTFNPC